MFSFLANCSQYIAFYIIALAKMLISMLSRLLCSRIRRDLLQTIYVQKSNWCARYRYCRNTSSLAQTERVVYESLLFELPVLIA